MREILKYFVKNVSSCFLRILISLLFVSLFIPKLFAQPTIHVSSFSYLSSLLADYSQSGIQISIDTPTIVSERNYDGCGGQKYITGSPDISVLDGNRFSGIYGEGDRVLHLSSITLCNFYKTAALSDRKNGATLFFQYNAKLYFDGNVNIISNTITGGGGSFDSNGGDCAGVCVNYGELHASSATINFIANISSDASGAALYFNDSKVDFFNTNILFQDNGSGDEGAALWAWENAQLYFTNSSVTFLRNRADLSSGKATTNPNPTGIGGAISIKQNSTNIYFQGTTEVDFTSNSARNGGAIYTGGTINFECASVVFSGNVATSSGGAIYINNGQDSTRGLLLDSSNGDIIFTGNQAGAGDAAGHDIYLEAGTVIINGSSGRVMINDGIAGTEVTTLNKSSSGLFLLGGSNQYFRGTFFQTGGTTTVVGKYFVGYSSITGTSVLELGNGVDLSAGGAIGLWDEAVMDITTSGDLTFSGEITGTTDSKIIKPSTGTLTLSGDNSGVEGTFIQSRGRTIVPNSDYMFGSNRIENSLLKVTMPDIGENREIEYRIFLSTGGILEHESTVNDSLSTTLTEKIEFVGDNARAIFKGNGYKGTWYVLEDKIPDSGANNEVQFINCYVDVDSDTYTGSTIYKFTNATIDMDFEDEGHFDYGTQPSTRIVQFDNLVTSNTVLNTTIVMISSSASGSMLAVKNNPGEKNKIKLGTLTVGELNGESGYIETHTVKLLDGFIEFEKSSESTIATLAYEYLITIDNDDLQKVIIDAYKIASGDSLNNMNKKEGNRALNFSFDSSTHTYYPNTNLSEMSSGSFYVEGHDEFNGESNIVAISTIGQRLSLFKINKEVDFQLMRLELISAQGEQGAALAVATNTANVLAMGITFSTNIATGSGGGAIYASNGAKLILNKTRFMGNSATAGNGGALYIEDGSEITFSGELQVIGNSASGNGGAIYVNNATLNVGVDTRSAKVFSGNTSGGVSNAIYLVGNSIINFGASGQNGTINMYDAIGSEEGNIGEVNLNGGTVFNLQTNGGIETIVPNLNIKEQSQFNIIGETEVKASSSITVDTNATLKIDGTAGYGMEVHVGNRFVHQGLLEMNLFGEATGMDRLKLKSFDLVSSDDSDYDSGDSDLINVDGGEIFIAGSSKLIIKTNDAFKNLGTVKSRAYKLMKYGKEGKYEGNFGTVTL
jgi:predicted outer membrane repeat protein